MDPAGFCTQSRLVIVAGKGGVGKTTVTAALARMASRAGLSTLIVEVEGKSGLVGLLGGSGELGYDEVTFSSGLGPEGTGELRARTITPTDALVDYFEEHSIADHPFFARMRREPVRLEVLARLLANFRVGITREFPRRLAWLTARVMDDAIRCVLAKQLNDEMGDGDFKRAHRGLLVDGQCAMAKDKKTGLRCCRSRRPRCCSTSWREPNSCT